MKHAGRVLMLGLDAADCDVMLDLVARNRLPNLGRLLDNGTFGRLQTPADHYAGGVWPTFYTGQAVPWHGIFHNKLWRPESMRVEVPSDTWMDARPFWESLSAAGVPVCVVDVPMVIGRPRPLNGVYLAGWGTHDLICKGSWPPELWRELQRRFGRPRMPPEFFGRQSASSLQRLAAQLLRSTDQLSDIGIELLTGHDWRFACMVFGSLHRAGHYLWDLSQIDDSGMGDAEAGASSGALAGIYENADTALGRIVERLPENTRVIVFAVHGMGSNPGWSDLLPDILSKLAARDPDVTSKRGLLYSLKQRIPYHWLRPVLTRLPGAFNERLVSIWSRRMFDWSQTRYFPVPMDETGYLRVNVRGRERCGIVEPGMDYDAVCDSLATLIRGLRDQATGAPIAAEVVRAYRDADAAAAYRRLIPDLIVPWGGPTATATRRLVADTQPGFVYEVPRRLPSGRSGNHTGNAWFVAHGPGIPRVRLDVEHSILDLVPTALDWLGVEPGHELQGQSMDFEAMR